MGQAVSPFETMGRRKMRGDDEGGPWVAPLPRAGHACSCSRGKILLIILCPLYVRRAWCGVGSHAGETSHRNVLCSLPRRLAQSGARVGPRGRRCYIANSRSAVWWRVWGLKPSAKPKKEKRKRWSIRGLRCPSSGHGPMRQSRKQLGEDSVPTAPGTLEAGRISSRPAVFVRGPAGRDN